MKKRLAVLSLILIILVMGFASAITKAELRDFLKTELKNYFEDKSTLLTTDELRETLNFYFTLSGGENNNVNFAGSGLSSENINLIEGLAEISSPSIQFEEFTCSDCDNRYYTKSETYTKEQINAMISTIESGGTGCPVGYTFYEQSTETAKCYKEGEVITARGIMGINWPFECMGRIVSGVLQSRAKYYYGATLKSDSGWLTGASTAVGYEELDHYNVAYCSINWVGVSGYSQDKTYTYTRIDLTPVSFGNILQIK